LNEFFQSLSKPYKKDAKYQKSTYVSVCGLEQSKEDAKALSEKAQKSLSAFDESEAKDELFALCDFLLFRNN
jgi:geranylgeranyl pyrophosphate synthase